MEDKAEVARWPEGVAYPVKVYLNKKNGESWEATATAGKLGYDLRHRGCAGYWKSRI